MYNSTQNYGEKTAFDRLKAISKKSLSRIHFVGIGGVSMSSLARLSHERGVMISGSDREKNRYTESLSLLGCRIDKGHRAENVWGADLVVYSQAIAGDNPELAEASRLAIPTISRAEYLGTLMQDYSNRIGVSGSHGKSTTVAMLDCIFAYAGAYPTVLSGADLSIGEPIRIGSREMLVYEACEYKDSFLSFSPTVAVGLNLELDHTDYFKDIAQIKASFTKALGRAKRLAILSGDDQNLVDIRKNLHCRSVTFGRGENCDYRYGGISYTHSGFEFSISRFGNEIDRFRLNIPGEYNIHNASGAIVAALEHGIDLQKVSDAISSYSGIARRLQRIGSRYGRDVYYDYAHHPTEIASVINALKMHIRMPITVIFKPHTYSRTEALWDDFRSALSLADHLLLLDIYPAREEPIPGITSERLAEAVGKSATYTTESEILNRLDFHTRGAIVLMGAGDFEGLNDKIVNNS